MLVTGSYLGSLSHTLTCLDVLDAPQARDQGAGRQRDAGLDRAARDTVETLTRFAAPIPVIEMPRLPADGGEHPAFDAIAALL